VSTPTNKNNSVAEVTGGGGAGGKKMKAGVEEEKMEFPQHKLPILNAAALKEIAAKTGVKMRVLEGRVKTGSVKKVGLALFTLFCSHFSHYFAVANDDSRVTVVH
jgi:hypothetical protein